MNLLQPCYAASVLSIVHQSVPQAGALQQQLRAELADTVLEEAARAGFDISPPNYVYHSARPVEGSLSVRLIATFTARVERPVQLFGGEKDGAEVTLTHQDWLPPARYVIESVNGERLLYERAGLHPREVQWVYTFTHSLQPDAPDAPN